MFRINICLSTTRTPNQKLLFTDSDQASATGSKIVFYDNNHIHYQKMFN
ncbi:hypothetical protein PMI13_00417 [Chryseobacterium populi]|uniref:Uncharacterized protein n=1 Tax=Chryseobacterium populi TaxID=1144316 RepID=J2K662_9FLAO|nr:hypothetical protein PMI13_00417 [Chryseobacterium populi]